MTDRKREISTDNIEIGMYVNELDRPWEETPFMIQGFCIKNDKEIALLKKFCRKVYIDRRYQSSFSPKEGSTGAISAQAGEKTLNEKLPLPKKQVEYNDKVSAEEEHEAAAANHLELTGRFKILFTPFRSGDKLNFEDLEEPIRKMVESVIRNPDAYMRLTVLRDKDDYTFNHCINMGILAVSLGRHLGLPRDDLNTLAWGTMFCDFGKASLPSELLKKVGRLSEDEFKTVQKHVQYSLEAIQSVDEVSQEALNIVSNHHERFNGSGYPNGLKGKEIPIYARIAAIVDTYDAIINDRPYARAVSPHDAIRELYELRESAFQPELVEAFIQSIGAYPIGTLVELNTGQIGIVISQNKVRHLKPKIMLILDKDKIAYKISPILDLFQDPVDKDNKAIVITRVLEPNSYGIKSEEIQRRT